MSKQLITSIPVIHGDAGPAPAPGGGTKTTFTERQSDCDVAIIGAGPVGLTLACALEKIGLSVNLLERQPRTVLEAPAPDGREIALTHRSIDMLKSLQIWPRIAGTEVAPIREARVLNGRSSRALSFNGRASGTSALGFLVPNHVIRQAAFAAAGTHANITLLDSVQVERVETDADAARLYLADGHILQARLIVAADSRLSDTRRQMGIGADLHDFGRDVIVCHLAHTAPNEGIAWECFGHGRTLALLPLNGNRVSAVLTAPSSEAAELMRLPDAIYAQLLTKQFGTRLGEMQIAGKRHNYPLVAVYAQRFSGPRFALAGDAAVGMHPVTAHGCNLGVYGVDALARALAQARAVGQDIGAAAPLRRYEAEHRRATLPLYFGTNALVSLFTDERGPARIARHALLGIADRLPPLKATITRQLTGAMPIPAGIPSLLRLLT